MVQIGNFQIGSVPAADKPLVSIGEAQILWDYLVARYRAIETTQIILHLAHDPDFKLFISKELKNALEQQANELEKELDTIGLPLPKRPPKSVSEAAGNPELFTDDCLFHQLLIGSGNFLDQITYSFRGMKTNDTLRKKFMGYLRTELEIYDDLMKYGKGKGWVEAPPMFTPH